jgi:hypothetical protein
MELEECETTTRPMELEPRTCRGAIDRWQRLSWTKRREPMTEPAEQPD